VSERFIAVRMYRRRPHHWPAMSAFTDTTVSVVLWAPRPIGVEQGIFNPDVGTPTGRVGTTPSSKAIDGWRTSAMR